MVNRTLTWWTLGAIVAYWLSGVIIPSPFTSSTASLALLVFGTITFFRYAPVAISFLVEGRPNVDDHQDGSRLAVLGTAMLAAGAVYSGSFGLWWVIVGQPEYWLGTPTSGFGRALMAGGFWLMYASPDVVHRDMRVPGVAWLTIIVMASILTGILLGSQLEIR